MAGFANKTLWAETMDTQASEDALLAHALAMGAGGVAVRTTSDRLAGAIDRFHSHGLKVYAWRWPNVEPHPTGRYAIDEAGYVVHTLIPAGLDGYIVDPEPAEKAPWRNWNRSDLPLVQLASDFCTIIRNGAGAAGKEDFLLGVTSGNTFPDWADHLPWQIFVSHADALFPQSYWHERKDGARCIAIQGGTPESALDKGLSSWRQIARGNPLIPIGGELSCIADPHEANRFITHAAAAGHDTVHFYCDEATLPAALLDTIRGTDELHPEALNVAGNISQSTALTIISRDRDRIPALLAIARDSTKLQAAQHTAAERLLDYDGEIFPQDGCAITLSVLLQEAGIDVKDTYQAITLGDVLKSRGWSVVEAASVQAGDVGSTCGPVANHGHDHIYVVLKPLNQDELIIADNQDTKPHFRLISGKNGKTPTKFFLRAN